MREEEGVEIFRGSIEGERDEERMSAAESGGGFGRIGGAGDWPCVWCIDRRFNRLVSVGLMVLAPRPVAWGS